MKPGRDSFFFIRLPFTLFLFFQFYFICVCLSRPDITYAAYIKIFGTALIFPDINSKYFIDFRPDVITTPHTVVVIVFEAKLLLIFLWRLTGGGEGRSMYVFSFYIFGKVIFHLPIYVICSEKKK